MQALISIHDVMPETMEKVDRHISMLRANGHQAFTLLVVPGRKWTHEELTQLARWKLEGLELAAHGWTHHAAHFGGAYHRLHAALISRRVAEHLSLKPEAVVRLMQDSADWFTTHGFECPTTYVPPAWALGRIGLHQLQELPYRRIETVRGFLQPATRRRVSLPLVGFEADTLLRKCILRALNWNQEARSRRYRRPLRIAIHPYDDELRLAEDLLRCTTSETQSMRYCDYLP